MRNTAIPSKFARVAVFGDSFASRSNDAEELSKTWFEILKDHHGFDVTTYGKNGASIEYIFNEFFHNYPRYDYVIFIKTSAGRFTLPKHIPVPDEFEFLRYNMANLIENNKTFAEKFAHGPVANALRALVDYYNYLFDERIASNTCNALAEYAKILKPTNLLVLDVVTGAEQNLMEISNKELEVAGLAMADMSKYADRRNCHLSQRNNEILAAKIATWIDTGEFELNIDHFEFDENLDKTKIFSKYDQF